MHEDNNKRENFRWDSDKGPCNGIKANVTWYIDSSSIYSLDWHIQLFT